MLIRISNGVVRHPDWRMHEPIDLEIGNGEQIAITGDNAAGKSRLVEVLTGHYPLLMNEVEYDFSPSPLPLASDNMKYIAFRDSYGEQDGTYYYQQRWNQHDIDEGTPTVGQLLQESYAKADASLAQCLHGKDLNTELERRHLLRQCLEELFHLGHLASRYIISLSSGELRKFQLARAMGTGPRLLIMDNPFIGLDAPTRAMLRDLLARMAEDIGLHLILVLSRDADIPDFITHVLHVEGLRLHPKQTLQQYLSARQSCNTIEESPISLPSDSTPATPLHLQDTDAILRFNNVSVRYGAHTILRPLSWVVRKGEHWAVSGDNGSGKSTLLSLICADNPQAYACDMELFGQKRGSGESIWEIKRHIGYVSPEMHRAYLRDMPAIDIVASGLSDSVGLYVRPKPSQREACLKWMETFGIAHLATTTFLRLSSGEQRLCLLARAFVKDPELLILDEPLHGLDERNRRHVRKVIDAFCRQGHKTLIMVTHYQEELPLCIDHTLTLPSASHDE